VVTRLRGVARKYSERGGYRLEEESIEPVEPKKVLKEKKKSNQKPNNARRREKEFLKNWRLGTRTKGGKKKK